MTQTKFYVLTCSYAGPNPQEHMDDDVCTIETQPGRTNSSHEIKTDGWLGTTNDWSRSAHGAFDTEAEARAEVAAIYPNGFRDVGLDNSSSDPDTEVARFKPGKLARWNRSDSVQWAYPARDELTADTTDERLAEIVAECVDNVADEGASLDTDSVLEMLTERRDELLADKTSGA
jgi:hypothetical protein